MVEVEPDPEVDEMVSSTLLSCSSQNESEASLNCVKTPEAELLESAAILRCTLLLALRYRIAGNFHGGNFDGY